MTGVSLQKKRQGTCVLPTIFITGIVRQHSFCKVYLVSFWLFKQLARKKANKPVSSGFGVWFFLPFWLQWMTGKKAANKLLISKDVRGFIFYFIWGDFWIKALDWFLVDNLFIWNSITFLVRWCVGFLQITVTVVQGHWKFLEILFCIVSTCIFF